MHQFFSPDTSFLRIYPKEIIKIEEQQQGCLLWYCLQKQEN